MSRGEDQKHKVSDLMIPTQSRDLFGWRDTKSRREKRKSAVTNDDDDEQ